MSPKKRSLIELLFIMLVIVVMTSFGYWAGSERATAEIRFELLPCSN